MYKYIYILFLGLLSIYACTEDTSSLKCEDLSDRIIGTRDSVHVISDGNNCIVRGCLEIAFDLRMDTTYSLKYSIFEDIDSTRQIIEMVEDQGFFTFECTEVGHLSGRFSNYRYIEGNLTLYSDFHGSVVWEISWNGKEGLLLQPEYIGLPSSYPYLILN